MKIQIDTEVLDKYNITLGEFLVMYMGYQDINYRKCYRDLMDKEVIDPNLFDTGSIILSNNTRNMVANILLESNSKLSKCNIDFEKLAFDLMNCYPSGPKSGTTYEWCGTKDEVVQKLRTLVVKYDFTFTEEEALVAVKDYVGSFNGNYKHMSLLPYFILKTVAKGDGTKEMSSMFMSTIEQNRDKNNK